jgi:hypothetical protein
VRQDSEKLEWITPASAVYQLAEFFGGADVAKAILAAQLKIGKLRARTTFLEIDQKIDFGDTVLKNGRRLPPKLEKIQQMERGGGVLELALGSWQSSSWPDDTDAWNWETGHFSVRRQSDDGITTIRCDYHGVKLAKPDVERLIPFPEGSKPKDGRVNSGTKKSETWNAWIAQLVLCVHHGSVTPSMSYSKLMKLVADELTKKAIAFPSDETVRPVATAALDALREDARIN